VHHSLSYHNSLCNSSCHSPFRYSDTLCPSFSPCVSPPADRLLRPLAANTRSPVPVTRARPRGRDTQSASGCSLFRVRFILQRSGTCMQCRMLCGTTGYVSLHPSVKGVGGQLIARDASNTCYRSSYLESWCSPIGRVFFSMAQVKA
jgi:hypothetical protein